MVPWKCPSKCYDCEFVYFLKDSHLYKFYYCPKNNLCLTNHGKNVTSFAGLIDKGSKTYPNLHKKFYPDFIIDMAQRGFDKMFPKNLKYEFCISENQRKELIQSLLQRQKERK